MKNKYNLISSIFYLAVGILAIISFILLSIGGEVMNKWLITLLLSIIFVIYGIVGIIDYNRKSKLK